MVSIEKSSTLLVLIFIALSCAAWATFDAFFSPHIPFPLFKYVLSEDFPFKLSIFLASALIILRLAYQSYRLVPRYDYMLIALIFVFAQTGGIKFGLLNGLDITILFGFLLILSDRLLNPHKTLFSPGLFYFAGVLVLLDIANFMQHFSVGHIVGLFGLLRVILLAWILVNVITDEDTGRFAIAVFIIVAVISALVGISQGILYWLVGIDFTFIEQFGASDTQYKPTPLGMLPRASAFNGSAQHLSSFLLIALPFTLFSRHAATGRQKVALTAAVFIILGGVLSTWNYGGFFAVLLVLLLYPFFQCPRYSLHILFGMTLFVLLCYYTGILDWLYSVSFGDSNVSKGVSQRYTLLSLGLEKLVKDPWFGEGLHGFASAPGNYWNRPVHNAYIQAATEIGILGSLVFIVMLLVMLTQALLSAKLLPTPWTGRLRATALSLIGLMWLMLTEPMVDHSNTWLLFGLTQGLLQTAWRIRGQTGRYSMPKAPPGWVAQRAGADGLCRPPEN